MPVDIDVPWGLPIDIGGHQYFIDPKKYSRQDLPALRQQVDQGAQAGAQTLSLEGSWTRAQTDWTLGGQQEVFDDETADPRRFFRQKDVQAVRRGRLQLSNALQQRSTADGDCQQWSWNERSFIQVGTSCYLLDLSGSTYRVKRFSIASGPYSAISVTTDISSATACLVLASDGTATTWVARGAAGVSRATSVGGAFTAAWSSVDTDVIAYCNGRLLGINEAEIFELDSGGLKVTIWTHGNVSWRWKGAVAGSGAIYAWGNAGNEAAVYVVDDVAPNGALQPPRIALPLPPGEVMQHLEPVSGIFVGRTNLGVRLVVPNGDGTLTLGPLVTMRDDPVTDVPAIPFAISASADAVFVAWRDTAAQPDWIGRLDLANFTGPLTPALHPAEYTADEAETTITNAAIRSLLVVNRNDTQYASGQLWVVGGDTALSTRRVWAASIFGSPNGDATARQKSTTGYCYSGWITLGIVELKQPVVVNVLHEALPAGASIVVVIVQDDATETTIGTQTATGSTFSTFDVDPAVIGPQRKFQLKLTLGRGTTPSATPVVESWAIRAMPTPQRQEEIVAAILMRPVVTKGDDGNQEQQDVEAEVAYLRALRDTRTPVTYTELGDTVTVIVDRVSWPPGEIEQIGNDRRAFNGTLFVRMLTVA